MKFLAPLLGDGNFILTFVLLDRFSRSPPREKINLFLFFLASYLCY